MAEVSEVLLKRSSLPLILPLAVSLKKPTAEEKLLRGVVFLKT
jgi:hypothetical protein